MIIWCLHSRFFVWVTASFIIRGSAVTTPKVALAPRFPIFIPILPVCFRTFVPPCTSPFPVDLAVFLMADLDLLRTVLLRFFSARIRSCSRSFLAIFSSAMALSRATARAFLATGIYTCEIASGSKVPSSHWRDCSFHTNSIAVSLSIRHFAEPSGVQASRPRYSMGFFRFVSAVPVLLLLLPLPTLLLSPLRFPLSSSPRFAASSNDFEFTLLLGGLWLILIDSSLSSLSRLTAFDAVFRARSTILS
mmetsp:Transcript_2366/g.6346  ORF Transcript_2366/g.6346 Transcript_2366/m.6346 type:complete len:248 (-) Transcript_2366:2340-3083(-)